MLLRFVRNFAGTTDIRYVNKEYIKEIKDNKEVILTEEGRNLFLDKLFKRDGGKITLLSK